MKKFLLFCFSVVLLTQAAISQCTNNVYGLYASLTPTCTGAWQTVTTCGWRGEYSNINVTAGNSYSFASSVGSDVVTITTTANAVLAWGTGTATWTATFTGTIRFYTHGPGCVTGTGCRTRRVMCSGPPPPPSCTDNPLVINMYDSWGDGWNGATYTIINDANGSTVGAGTLSTGSSGTSSMYCVLDGCYTILVSNGSFPSEVSWTATINGVVYASGGAGSSTQLPINSFCAPPTPEMKLPSNGSNSYTVCEGTLYDDGGSLGNYSVNASGYTVLYPGMTGAKVSLSFNTFYLENGWDYLYIYDGPNTSSPLIGVYSGSTSPGNVISTAADGSLSIRLVSDGSIQYSGFSAEVSCLLALPVDMLSFTGYNKNEHNLISWVVGSEHNSDYYVIERSTSGNFESYTEIAYIQSHGNINTGVNYFFSDNSFRPTINYYRLRQVDKDGKETRYGAVSIDNTNNEKIIDRYVNTLGQEVNPLTATGLVITVFRDGSIQKTIR